MMRIKNIAGVYAQPWNPVEALQKHFGQGEWILSSH